MAKFSIILPCYNVEQYLARSIESVLKQTLTDFELLVVIDGSPDNSLQIANSYASQDHRIQVFSKENGGLSDARNYGLNKAQGEYIYFMDSDDWIEEKLLEDNLKIVETEQLDFIVFGYTQDNEDTEGLVVNSVNILPKMFCWEKTKGNLIIDNHHLGLLGYAWNKIYRKAFLDRYKLQFQKGISLVEDILFNVEVYKQSNIIRFNPQLYYHYLNRPVTTLMKTFHKDSLDLVLLRTNALEGFLVNWNLLTSQIQQITSTYYFQGIKYLINAFQGSYSEQLDYFSKILDNKLTKQYINYYKPRSIKEIVYKLLVKYKLYRLISIFKS